MALANVVRNSCCFCCSGPSGLMITRAWLEYTTLIQFSEERCTEIIRSAIADVNDFNDFEDSCGQSGLGLRCPVLNALCGIPESKSAP